MSSLSVPVCKASLWRTLLRCCVVVCALGAGACAHKPAAKPIAPKFSAEQVRARAGRWGGPEVGLTADAMAYAAGRAPELVAWAEKLGHAPLLHVWPLLDETGEGVDAVGYARALSQAMTNGGHFEVAGPEVPASSLQGHVRSTLSSEPLQVEGQRATLYTVTVLVADAQEQPLWQRREVIRKWSAPPDAVAEPPHLLPLD